MQCHFYPSQPRRVLLASQHVSLHGMHGNTTHKGAHDSPCTALYFFNDMLLCLNNSEAHVIGLYYPTDLNYHLEGDKD